MRSNKKGVALPVEFLLRLLIVIFLVIVIFNIGKDVGRYVFQNFFGTGLDEHFNEFVNELNKIGIINVPSRHVFMVLDQNTAIIGFSTSSERFSCFACGSGTGTDITSFFYKPDNQECKGKSCVCLCSNGLQMSDSSPYQMKCDKMRCASLNKDLAESVELKGYIEKLEKEQQVSYRDLKNAKWTGGFLFERNSKANFIPNGLPQPSSSRFTVYVTKESTEDNAYLGVCPDVECKYTFKTTPKDTTQAKELPPDICIIMSDCFKKEHTGYQKDIDRVPNDRCSPYQSPEIRQYTKEDCEKVQQCVISKGITNPSKCIDKGSFFVLSFVTQTGGSG